MPQNKVSGAPEPSPERVILLKFNQIAQMGERFCVCKKQPYTGY